MPQHVLTSETPVKNLAVIHWCRPLKRGGLYFFFCVVTITGMQPPSTALLRSDSRSHWLFWQLSETVQCNWEHKSYIKNDVNDVTHSIISHQSSLLHLLNLLVQHFQVLFVIYVFRIVYSIRVQICLTFWTHCITRSFMESLGHKDYIFIDLWAELEWNWWATMLPDAVNEQHRSAALMQPFLETGK